MKQTFFLLALAFGLLPAAAQKVINDPNVESRPVTSFHSISVASGIDLYLSQGTEAVAVSAKDAATAKEIKVEVVNGTLKIWYDWKDKMVFSNSKRLRAYVAYKTLKSLNASGGSDVFVDGTIEAEDFNMHISGGSDFKGKVVAQKELHITQSGGSDISISGSANAVWISASGGSDFNGFDLVTGDCTAEASGGSDIKITSNGQLKANVSGGSDVIYKGSATEARVDKSGGSSVHKSGR
jgi:hypothetical protein